MKYKSHLIYLVCLFVLMSSVIFASSAYQQIKFEIQHTNCPEVRRAGQLLIDSGVISPTSGGICSHTPDSRLTFNELFLQQAIKRDIIKQQVPSELKELNLSIVDNYLQVRGRLDGPLFINPSFTLPYFQGHLTQLF